MAGVDVMADDPYARIAELEAENAALRVENSSLTAERSLAQDGQTAAAEILRVIATSPADAQPVLNAIAESAFRLSRSITGAVSIREGDLIRLVARAPRGSDGRPPGDLTKVSDVQPGHIAMREGRTLHIPDRSTREFRARFPESSSGPWASLHLPLNGQAGCIGNMTVYRDAVEPYSCLLYTSDAADE